MYKDVKSDIVGFFNSRRKVFFLKDSRVQTCKAIEFVGLAFING
jgi:hypothetical protein